MVGATVDESCLDMFRDAGFEPVEGLRDYDYFAHSPSQKTRKVASQFGVHAVELRMTRHEKAPAEVVQWVNRLDPRRLLNNIQRRGLWGSLSLLMAAITCYGTLMLVALMSAFGVSIAINEGLWAGGIILFALVATAVIAIGVRIYHSIKPLLIALLGTGIISYTMLVSYSTLTEIAGFLILALATYLDYDRRRWARVKGG